MLLPEALSHSKIRLTFSKSRKLGLASCSSRCLHIFLTLAATLPRPYVFIVFVPGPPIFSLL